MLSDTAVVVTSEHGRTPRVQNVARGGRDHWARAYSASFAGEGFAAGRVVGRTDRIGGDVTEGPSPVRAARNTIAPTATTAPRTAEATSKRNRLTGGMSELPVR